jgi:hypothetical protein
MDEVLIAEWLAKKTNRASGESPAARLGLREGGHKDNRQAATSSNQFALQFDAGHTRHLHVGNEAIGLADKIRWRKASADAKGSTP